MRAKNRGAKGETHRTKTHPELVLRGSEIGTSKLTEEIVKAIRSEYVRGIAGYKTSTSLTGLAKKYGIAFQTVSKIVNNKSWVHV